ncbi:MAG: FAD binding domain-containing protein [Arenicellales bacterium]|nr:FAD binding domain-containing protein [Arenicellales bacterium]
MTRHFEYLRPETIDAAIGMKIEYGPQAKFWAGGTDMMLLWQRCQIARRSIYGVDINEVAVRPARLAIWIHTFVDARLWWSLIPISPLAAFPGFNWSPVPMESP